MKEMLKGVYEGCTAYFKVYEVISRLKLWKFFAIPMLISFIVFLMILFIAFSFSDAIGNYISSFWTWDFGKETINTLSKIFGSLLIVLIGFISFKHITMALSAPFMGPISKKIEDDFNNDYVNSFLNYLIGFTEHFYDIKPLVEEKLFDEFSTNKFNNFYFAYGSNMDPRQMEQRCPGAIPVGIGNLAFYKNLNKI